MTGDAAQDGMDGGAVEAEVVVTGSGSVLRPGWMLVQSGRIARIRSGRAPRDLVRRRGGPGSVLIPGLVSAHTHLALGDLAGVADDEPFLSWIRDGVVPALNARGSDAAAYAEGAGRSVAALLRCGVTTVGDNFLNTAGAHALRVAGLQGVHFQEVFGSRAEDLDAYSVRMEAGLDAVEAELEGFPVGYSPHTLWTCPPAVFRRVAGRARASGRRLSYHLGESAEEDRFFRTGDGPLAGLLASPAHCSRYPRGTSPFALAAELGGLGPHVVVAHAVTASEDDARLLAASGASVAHCPTSNAKLAEGVAPVALLLSSGVNVALGLDSAASTGRLDIFQEMRAALLFGRAAGAAIGPFTAGLALHMATLAGARALGLEEATGSLVPGKRADAVLLRFDPGDARLASRPLDLVVWEGSPERVEHVFAGGREVWRRAAHGR